MLAVALAASACSGSDSAGTDSDADPAAEAGTDAAGDPVADMSAIEFPEVIDAVITPTGDTFRVEVTISSPYDSPERYADAWRVKASDGTELAVRELTHDHAGEQPFTRSLDGVEIPADVTVVVVEGRDLANGWGGGSLELSVPGRPPA